MIFKLDHNQKSSLLSEFVNTNIFIQHKMLKLILLGDNSGVCIFSNMK